MLDGELLTWLKEEHGQEITRVLPISGGSISRAQRIEMSDGVSYFFKSNTNAPEGMFAAEKEGLELLAAGPGPHIPKIIYFSESYILMEYLKAGKKNIHWGRQLGQELALMHQRKSKTFGLERDNFIGSSPQKNKQSNNGYEFFAEHRLGFQNRMARNSKLLTMSESVQVDQLADRLEALIPNQEASLLHGDLWTGNAIWDEEGLPALVDPAVYYGWPEADIAMTVLFGNFGDDFYSAYQSMANLEIGWRKRLPLYNLYHLLNHLNLFGSSYHDQVMATIRNFL